MIKIQKNTPYRNKFMNSYWCDYCYYGIFIHEKSVFIFIDRCIKIFTEQKKIFFDTIYAHELGSMLSINQFSRDYLQKRCPLLFSKYRLSKISADASSYVTNGIIDHHNKQTYHSTSTCCSFDEWLLTNNLRCELCNSLSCPFHTLYGAFNLVEHNNKTKYCCGWCDDTLAKNNIIPLNDII